MSYRVTRHADPHSRRARRVRRGGSPSRRPLRAKHIAETFLTDVEQRNSERGLLGYTGLYKGRPVSVQGTGMGCPGATIVFEELIQLGCKKLIRVGTCGGLQPHHALGDLIVACRPCRPTRPRCTS